MKKDIKEVEIDDFKEIEKDLNDTNISELIENKLKDHNFFFVHFVKKLKEDKIYFISFIITLIFFGCLTTIKVKHSDSALYKNNKTKEVVNNENDTTLTPVNEIKDEKVDVSDYVGIYSKEYFLDNVITFGDNCSVDSYKYIYQVSIDGTITKYFYNSCIGTIKIWSDEVKYNNDNGARYIGTTKMNFTFTTNKIKEVDGETYKTDTDITTIKENKNLDEIELNFYGSTLVVMTNTNLIVVDKDKVSSPINEKYTNNGGDLQKRFYKSSTEYEYKFIIFNQDIEETCSEEESEDVVYTIYTIRYDASSNNFLEPKTTVSRTKSDSCKNYKKDLANLKE